MKADCIFPAVLIQHTATQPDNTSWWCSSKAFYTSIHSGRPSLSWADMNGMHTRILSTRAPGLDSCILSRCSTRGGKKTRGQCRGYRGRWVILCICFSLPSVFRKESPTSGSFALTGHTRGGGSGSGFNSLLANQWGHWQLQQVAGGGLMKGEHMLSGTSNFREWHTTSNSPDGFFSSYRREVIKGIYRASRGFILGYSWGGTFSRWE